MKIIEGDITKLEVDGIVNAANSQLKHQGGVAALIVEAGGEEIQKESAKIGYCPIGEACVTSAGALKAKYVIHVPTIDYTTGKKATADDIFRGASSALMRAKKLGLKSVAFPLLGAGVVKLSEEEVKVQIRKAAALFPSIEVTLCVKVNHYG